MSISWTQDTTKRSWIRPCVALFAGIYMSISWTTKINRIAKDKRDQMIMTIDTSTMDEQAKQYFHLMKEEILARRFGIGNP
jgi:hypothetical protein